jgi:hypothetical protein
MDIIWIFALLGGAVASLKLHRHGGAGRHVTALLASASAGPSGLGMRTGTQLSRLQRFGLTLRLWSSAEPSPA